MRPRLTDVLRRGQGRTLTLRHAVEADGTWPELAGRGPWDRVVDATGDPDGQVRRLDALLRLVVPGGVYEVVRPTPAVRAHLERLTSEPPRGPEDRSLRRAVASWSHHGRRLRVVRGRPTLAVLREDELNRALLADPGRGRVLDSLPAATLRSRCELRTSDGARPARMRTTYRAPEAFLREYRDVVVGPKSVLLQRGLVLPDTYRHGTRKVLQHRSLRRSGDAYVVPPFDASDASDAPELEGPFFHLDNEVRGFFGHALTEQVSRLWAWERARRREPGLRALVTRNRGRGLAGWESTLLAAGGVDPDDLVLVDGPVRVDRLLSASPLWSMPKYVHPAVVETWDRMGAALLAQAGTPVTGHRIFCSRRHDKRACQNRAEVEALFAAHGFDVVFPEEHPLPDQVALFHDADVVAGFAGSGLFTVQFSDRPKHLVVLRPDTYGPSNEYMIAAARGHRLDLVTSRAHVPRGSASSFRSDFTVDLEAEGRWLRDRLAELD